MLLFFLPTFSSIGVPPLSSSPSSIRDVLGREVNALGLLAAPEGPDDDEPPASAVAPLAIRVSYFAFSAS
jgi:hypothetical protein